MHQRDSAAHCLDSPQRSTWRMGCTRQQYQEYLLQCITTLHLTIHMIHSGCLQRKLSVTLPKLPTHHRNERLPWSAVKQQVLIHSLYAHPRLRHHGKRCYHDSWNVLLPYNLKPVTNGISWQPVSQQWTAEHRTLFIQFFSITKSTQ